MPQNYWEQGATALQLPAQRREHVTASMNHSTSCLALFPIKISPLFSLMWLSQSLPLCWQAKPRIPTAPPLIPQCSSHFPHSPLLHYVLILLPISIDVCNSLYSCATLSECHYGFWHSQINILEILLWLKCIYSQRLLFFLSWLWGFASGTIYIDAGLALLGLLLMSPRVSGYEVAHALLNYLAC